MLNLTVENPFRLFMKHSYLVLSAALLLAGCNQTAPVTSTPTAALAATAPAPSPVATSDSAAAPADATATAPASAAAGALAGLPEGQTLKMSFGFKPSADPDNPGHPRTSAHLVLQGPKAQEVDLGKFANKPDVVDAVKAKEASFPAGMLLGFRSYDPSSGVFSDLAVMKVDARHLRIVQRRVEETNPEGGKFETAREIPLPANTTVVVVPVAPAPTAKK